MARIRSIKPEAFQSETLAEISLPAERTFYGLSTLADDHGRFADKPAQINGDLWSMRNACAAGALHTPGDLEDELAEMGKADLICRYIGCDGKRYGHFMTWERHQKIDKPSKPRHPRCPDHPAPRDDECGIHGKEPCPLQEDSRGLASVSGGFATASESFSQPPAPLGDLSGESGPGTVATSREPVATVPLIASDLQVPEVSGEFEEPSRDSREGSMLDLGSRIKGSKEVQPSAAADEPQPTPPLTITQRSKRITDAYHAAQPMCRWPAINGIVQLAIKSNKYDDGEIEAAMLRLAKEGRSVSVESLRIELEGLVPLPPGRASPTSRVRDIANATQRLEKKLEGSQTA
jgi:hypothetical protein